MTTTPSMLFVDRYSGNGPHPDWAPVAQDPTYAGVILKATDGISYPVGWFQKNWGTVKSAAANRYGDTFFRGAYHYLEFFDDPRAQAEFYLTTIASAGGWDTGDLIPIVDVERGRQPAKNHTATKSRVIDVTTSFIELIKTETGQEVMLYGRGAMRDLGITSQMKARYLWDPAYQASFEGALVRAVGWEPNTVALWQYCGTHSFAPGLPDAAPGLGVCDHSKFMGEDLQQLKSTIIRRP